MEKAKKILQKIREENIQPIPKWRFTAKNILIWLAFASAVLIGAMAFSVILFSIQQTDFQLVSHLSHSTRELLLGILPFFWLIALLIFLVVAIFSLRKSRKGYKYGLGPLLGYSIAISIVLGTLFFIGGGAQWLESSFASRVSIYESLAEKKMKVWMQPEAGFLAGTIENLQGDSLRLSDFRDKKWNISYDGAWIAPPVSLQAGEQIKLLGRMTSPGSFAAEEIRPWGGGRGARPMPQR